MKWILLALALGLAAPTAAQDFDSDGIPDAADRCPTIVDTGTDTDGDGVDNACDTCTALFNPPFTGPMTNRTTVSGQLDDDANGQGNRCDFDYNNQCVTIVAVDFNDMKASVGKLVSASNCGAPVAAGGSGDTQRCGEFDHDGVGLVITSNDFKLAKLALGTLCALPKCAVCNVGTGWSDALGTGGERLGRPICQTTVPGACVYAP